MLVKLSTDVWRDVFEWLLPADRRKLAQISTQDWQFSEVCQKWLHKWTKNVRLGPMLIIQPTKWIRKRGERLARNVNPESSRLQCWDYGEESWMKQEEAAVPILMLESVELSSNIVDFSEIECRYLDTKVFGFLRRMLMLSNHQNNINLHVEYNDKSLDRTETALNHLMPFLADTNQSIESMAVTKYSFQLLFTIRDRFPNQFYGLKQLEVSDCLLMPQEPDMLIQWLTTRRADGKPRKLIVSGFDDIVHKFIYRIQQNFANATSPVSFVVCLYEDNDHYGAFCGEMFCRWSIFTRHGRINEQLVVKPMGDVVLIGRCPAELDGMKWVEEMNNCDASDSGGRRLISIASPTLGPIGEETKPEKEKEGKHENDDHEDEDDVDKPGPSKKQKLA